MHMCTSALVRRWSGSLCCCMLTHQANLKTPEKFEKQYAKDSARHDGHCTRCMWFPQHPDSSAIHLIPSQQPWSSTHLQSRILTAPLC